MDFLFRYVALVDTYIHFFFFQAEDGIRDLTVTGVQTCALPISIRKVKELATNIPDSFTALQFENQANPEFHYETTARELFEQMDGNIDAVVIGVGDRKSVV